MPREGMQDGRKGRSTRPQCRGWCGPIRKLVYHPTEAAGGLVTLSPGLSRLEARWEGTYPAVSSRLSAECGRGRGSRVLVCFFRNVNAPLIRPR